MSIHQSPLGSSRLQIQALPGPARPSQALPGPLRPCQALSGPARLCQALPGSVRLSQALPGPLSLLSSAPPHSPLAPSPKLSAPKYLIDGWMESSPLCSTGHRPLWGRCPASLSLKSPYLSAGQGYCCPIMLHETGFFSFFLDASSHLYKRLCLSIRRSVRPSVGHAFVKNEGNQYFRANKRRFTRLTRCMMPCFMRHF